MGALFLEGLQEDDLDCRGKVGALECVFLLTVSFQEPHVGSFPPTSLSLFSSLPMEFILPISYVIVKMK